MLPYAPDAWYVPDSVKTGYEISFTRYFYKPAPMRSLEEIRADILALERETEGLWRRSWGRRRDRGVEAVPDLKPSGVQWLGDVPTTLGSTPWEVALPS